MEKKVLNFFNNKLELQLTGDEIKLNLKNKNITNIDLSLLCEIEFKNLTDINLSSNNISNIEPIQNFKNLKTIDLSFNKINNIKPLKRILENNKEIKTINLNNNEISDEENIKENFSHRFIEINLDNNNIIKKDIESFKNSIFGNSISKYSKNYCVIRRVISEFKDLQKNPIGNIGLSVGLINYDCINEWSCDFIGSPDTPYAGGLFNFMVFFLIIIQMKPLK